MVFMHYAFAFFHYFVQYGVYISFHFLPILLIKYIFIFLCFLSALCFEFDVISMDFKNICIIDEWKLGKTSSDKNICKISRHFSSTKIFPDNFKRNLFKNFSLFYLFLKFDCIFICQNQSLVWYFRHRSGFHFPFAHYRHLNNLLQQWYLSSDFIFTFIIIIFN